MTTPAPIHAAFRRRVDTIKRQRHLPEDTRRALIAQAWVKARADMRAARTNYRAQTDDPPDRGERQADMTSLIRDLAAVPSNRRGNAHEAITFGLAVPPELAGMQPSEVERLARQADFPDDAA